MFGLSHIARRARKWRADQKRAAMEMVLQDLPVELRKDIGWPVARDHPQVGNPQREIHARPVS